MRACALLLLVLLLGGTAHAEPLVLDRCINTALQNNLDIREQQLNLDISVRQEASARAAFYPTFSLVGSDGYVKDGPYNLGYACAVVRQPLYSGGKLTNDVKASQQNRSAKLYNLHNSELALENKVFREYMNCLRYWKFSRAYGDGIERAQAQLAVVRSEVREGRRGGEDLLRWSVLLDDFREKLVNADKDLANAKVRLNTLMNRPAEEPLEVLDSHPLRFEYADFMIRQKHYTAEQMTGMFLDYAMVFDPVYRQRRAEANAASHNLLSEKATLRPTVDLVSDYSGRSQPLWGVYNLWDTGLSMSFDLYKRQKYENVKIKQLQLELSKVKEQQFLRDLRSDVRTLYATNASLNEQVSLRRKQQKTSREYLREISARYAAGRASNLDVIEAFSSLYQNQITLVDSIYNAFSEFASLLNMIGFSFTYKRPAPNMYWRYKDHGLQLDYELKGLDDGTFRFLDGGDPGKLKAMLGCNPSLAGLRSGTGDTALHYAVDRGYEKCVELLLEAGADPDAPNHLDGTPLVRAIIYCPAAKNLAITKLLIGHKADVNKVSHQYAPLNWAAMKNKLELVKLLVRAGAKVNAQDPDMKLSPLHFSAFWGNVEMARFLLESGADMALENGDSLTAYDLAWQFEHKELVEFFDKRGAK